MNTALNVLSLLLLIVGFPIGAAAATHHNIVSDCHANGGVIIEKEWHGLPFETICRTY